jgi:hypothetical protein
MADTFELFPPGATCNKALPLNAIKDEFIVARFLNLGLPFAAQAAGTSVVAAGSASGNDGVPAQLVPAVLPRDVVEPEVARLLLEQSPQVSTVDIKGGVPLASEWQQVVLPRPPVRDPAIQEVVVEDLDSFLANPVVILDGKARPVDLTPGAVGALLADGTATAVLVDGDVPQLVALRVSGTSAEESDLEGAIPVGDLFAFISEPQIEVTADGPTAVTLKADNIEELRRVGTTELEFSVGVEQRRAFVTAAKPSTGLKKGTGQIRPLFPPPGTKGSVFDPGQTVSLGELYPTFELVLYLPYRHTWKLLGYSRGELLNSISLAPQEETTIEVFTWDRFKRSSEESTAFELDGVLESTTTDKNSRETLKEAGKESGWTFNADGRIGINIGEVVQIGGSVSDQTKNNIRDASRSTKQKIHESVVKASTRIKTSHQTKVSEVEEFGSETRVTRKLRNPNTCRTLNLDCFETVASYEVTTELVLEQARICALTPNPISGPFSRSFVITHEAALRRALLSRVYEPGLEAARLLAAAGQLCEVTKMLHCASAVSTAAGGAASAGSQVVQAAREKVEKAAQAIKIAHDQVRQTASVTDILSLIIIVPQLNQAVLGGDKDAQTGALTRFHRFLYFAHFVSASRTDSRLVWFLTLEEFAKRSDFSPEAAERVLTAAAAQPSEVLNVKANLPIYALPLKTLISRELSSENQLALEILRNNVGLDDGGTYEAVAQLRTAYDEYRTAVAPGPAQDGSKQKLAEWEAITDYSAKDIADAKVRESALLAHMQVNEAYYRHAVWESLNPNDRQLFLSSLGNLMNLVENEPLGFVGTKAALPLRAQTLQAFSSLKTWFEGNVVQNGALGEQLAALTVTLPTPGVSIEARLGECDACEEFVSKQRELELRQRAAEAKSAEERAKQEESETERYKKRLQATEPKLDDPDPNQGTQAIRIMLQQP